MLTADLLSELVDAWRRHQGDFWEHTGVFLSLVLRGLGLALLLGIPAGIALTRLPRLAAPVVAVLGLLQTVPSMAILGLLIPWLGTGEPPALFAAVVYSLFPLVMNTHVGITQVSAAVRDAARGMGMTGRQVLWHVELPLAMPVMLAGVRTGAIYAIGVVTICAFIGAGGLGDYIFRGLNRGDNGLMWLGAIPILVLTLLLFWGLGRIARLSERHSALGMSLGVGLVLVLSAYAVYGVAVTILRGWDEPGRANTVRIGGKDFTEGQILAEMLKQMLEAHTQLRVELQPNLGTAIIFQSLRSGNIDMYPEYTGVLLTSKDALDSRVPADRSAITGLVREQVRRRFGLELLEPFGLNNTYALCVTRETARRHGLRTISDLVRAPGLRVVVDLSFLERPDGWPGLAAKYGLRFDQPPRQMSPDLIYRPLESDKADLVVGFATDWQIDALNLVVLEDDRSYFPSYHGAPLVRGDVLERHPEVGKVLNRLGGKIDDAAMRRLNFQVAVGKRSERDVVREFLRQRGLLGNLQSAARAGGRRGAPTPSAKLIGAFSRLRCDLPKCGLGDGPWVIGDGKEALGRWALPNQLAVPAFGLSLCETVALENAKDFVGLHASAPSVLGTLTSTVRRSVSRTSAGMGKFSSSMPSRWKASASRAIARASSRSRPWVPRSSAGTLAQMKPVSGSCS
jgi:osmoprotectant transport system permease protein